MWGIIGSRWSPVERPNLAWERPGLSSHLSAGPACSPVQPASALSKDRRTIPCSSQGKDRSDPACFFLHQGPPEPCLASGGREGVRTFSAGMRRGVALGLCCHQRRGLQAAKHPWFSRGPGGGGWEAGRTTPCRRKPSQSQAGPLAIYSQDSEWPTRAQVWSQTFSTPPSSALWHLASVPLCRWGQGTLLPFSCSATKSSPHPYSLESLLPFV